MAKITEKVWKHPSRTPDTNPDKGTRKTYEYDPHLDPQLAWAGKAEHTSFEVPTVSLHVHERIDPKTIIEATRKRNAKGGDGQMLLFEQPDENPPLREAIEFYKHAHNWTNRLIAGDSLLVMTSLLEKEGMAGKVQMVYIDPPYGIRYGSNFQPFVNKRDVKDGKDDDLTQEPEMIRAFRDTWELGIHSYLTYLRDRLLLARELLHESGSCFVQINDENVHLVRSMTDEVFGNKNFVSEVAFQTTSSLGGSGLGKSFDYLVWYAHDIARLKLRRLFRPKGIQDDIGGRFTRVQLADGTRRVLTTEERHNPNLLHPDSRIYRHDNLTSQSGTETSQFPVELDGDLFRPGRGYWKTNEQGMDRLRAARRLAAPTSNSLTYVRFLDDFPYMESSNVWGDTQTGAFSDPKIYAVQTNVKVISRCMLMTTDPGDLVLDPTCGSGTSA